MCNVVILALLLLPPCDLPSVLESDTDKSREGLIVIRRCSVEYERDTLIGSSLPGVLQDCLVRPGTVIKAGQVLGRLQDLDAHAELEIKTAEAASDVEVRLGEARLAQARNKLATSESLYRRNAMSREELESDRLEVRSATLMSEATRHRRSMAEIERRRAEALLRMRHLISPHDGVVIAVLKAQGESVSLNEPVFRLVNSERMKVTGYLDLSEAWKPAPGRRVRVRVEVDGADLPIEDESFDGMLTFVDTQIDPATQTCKVFAEVINRDGRLRSGLKARLEILPSRAVAEKAPPQPVGLDRVPATAAPLVIDSRCR